MSDQTFAEANRLFRSKDSKLNDSRNSNTDSKVSSRLSDEDLMTLTLALTLALTLTPTPTLTQVSSKLSDEDFIEQVSA